MKELPREITENGIHYTLHSDYYLPDLKLPDVESRTLGKYGRLHRQFLKEHKQVLYNELILSGKLFEHLYEIDAIANSRLDLLMEQYLEIEPAPDKRTNQMGWVQHMNRLKAQAEEVILNELVYGV